MGRDASFRPPVLVTGGAGYIGSHVVHALHEAGWPLLVLDDLSTGRPDTLPRGVPLIEGDVGDHALLAQLFAQRPIAAVLHFAGSIRVEESIREPLRYYRNNTIASQALIAGCVGAGIDALIFSSTAAVYGTPEMVPVGEEAPTRPISPYGWSKLMTERMLRDAASAHRLRHVVLRYFNVAGTDPAGRVAPAAAGADHLIKVACEAVLGRRDRVPLYGTDYPTADGTCIRDFIHVSDLADAHLAALEYLLAGGPGRSKASIVGSSPSPVSQRIRLRQRNSAIRGRRYTAFSRMVVAANCRMSDAGWPTVILCPASLLSKANSSSANM